MEAVETSTIGKDLREYFDGDLGKIVNKTINNIFANKRFYWFLTRIINYRDSMVNKLTI